MTLSLKKTLVFITFLTFQLLNVVFAQAPVLEFDPINSTNNINFNQASLGTTIPITREFVFKNTSANSFSGTLIFKEQNFGSFIVSAPASSIPTTTSSQGLTAPNFPNVPNGYEIHVSTIGSIAPGETVTFFVETSISDCVLSSPDNLADGRTEVLLIYDDNSSPIDTTPILSTQMSIDEGAPTLSIRREDGLGNTFNEYNCLNNSNPIGTDVRSYVIENTSITTNGHADGLLVQIQEGISNATGQFSMSTFTEPTAWDITNGFPGVPLTVTLYDDLPAFNNSAGIYTAGVKRKTYEVTMPYQGEIVSGTKILVTYNVEHICPSTPAELATFFNEGKVVLNNAILGARFTKDCLPAFSSPLFPWVTQNLFDYSAHANGNYNFQPMNHLEMNQGLISGAATLLNDIDNGIIDTSEYCINSDLRYNSLNNVVQLGTPQQVISDPAQMRMHVKIDIGPFLDYADSNLIVLRGTVSGTAIDITGTVVSNITNPINGHDELEIIYELPTGLTFDFFETNPVNANMYAPYQSEWRLTPEFHDFFTQGFDVCFKLAADCSDLDPNFEGTIAEVTEEFYISFGNNVCTTPCLIPMQTATRDVVVTCPGCTVPGWNITESSMERTSFDALDNSNNHFPDDHLDPTSIAGTGTSEPERGIITTGDIFSLYLEADISDGGVFLDTTGINDTTCNLSFASNIWDPFNFGELELSGPILANSTFLGAKAVYYPLGNPTGVPLTIPKQAIVPVPDPCPGGSTNDLWFLSMDPSELSTYSNGNLTISEFSNGDEIEFTVFFQLNTPPLNTAVTPEQIDSRIKMSHTEFSPTLCKPDALNLGCYDLSGGDQAFRNDHFHWCTGGTAEIKTVGLEVESIASSIDHVGAGINTNTCLQQINLIAVSAVGQNGIGFGTVSPNEIFPNEIRNFNDLEGISFSIPVGFVFDHLEIGVSTLDTSSTSGFSCGFTNSGGVSLPNTISLTANDLSLVGGTVSLTGVDLSNLIYEGDGLSPAFNCAAGNSISLYDEFKVYNFNCFVRLDDCPSTSLPAGAVSLAGNPIIVDWSKRPDFSIGPDNTSCDCDNPQNCPDLATFIDTIDMSGSILTVPDHAISASVSPIVQNTTQADISFDLLFEIDSIGANSQLGVNNFFFYLESDCGVFGNTDLGLTWSDGTTIPYNSQTGVYEVGFLGFNAPGMQQLLNPANTWQGSINISGDYFCDACNETDPETIVVHYGWNCDGFPASNPPPANSLCFADSLETTVLPSNADLNAINILNGPLVINPCSTSTIELELDVTGGFQVENTLLTIDLPAGMSFDVNTNLVLTYDAISDTFATANFTGNSVTINLNNDAIGANQAFFEGLCSCDPTISFNVITDCNYLGGAILFSAIAENYCGGTVPVSGIPVQLSVTPQYTTPLVHDVLDILSVNISPFDCSTNSADITVVIQNNGGAASSGLNTELIINLPPPFSSVTTSITQVIGSGQTTQITIPISSSSNPGCITLPVDVSIEQNTTISCFGQTCGSLEELSSFVYDWMIQIPQLDINLFEVNCDGISVEIENSGIQNATGWELTLYCSDGTQTLTTCNGGVLFSQSGISVNSLNTLLLNPSVSICPECVEIMLVLENPNCQCAPVILSVPNSNQGQWHQSTSLSYGNDEGNDLVLDDAGNIYVTGNIGESVTFHDGVNNSPIHISALQSGTFIQGKQEMYVAKYNRCGALEWVNFSVDGAVWGNGIDIEETTGEVYVCGVSLNGSFRTDAATPQVPNAVSSVLTPSTPGTGYVARYNMQTGQLVTTPFTSASLHNSGNNFTEFETIKVKNPQEIYLGGRVGNPINVFNNLNQYYGLPGFSMMAKVDPTSTNAYTWMNKTNTLCIPCGVKDIDLIDIDGATDVWSTGSIKGETSWLTDAGFYYPIGVASTNVNPMITNFKDLGTTSSLLLFEGGNTEKGLGEGIEITDDGWLFFTGTFKKSMIAPFGMNQNVAGSSTGFLTYMGGFPTDQTGYSFIDKFGQKGGASIGKAIVESQGLLYCVGQFSGGELYPPYSQLPLSCPLVPSTGITSPKVFYTAFDLSANPPVLSWANVTEGASNHIIESIVIDTASMHSYSIGKYKKEMDFHCNQLQPAAPLVATIDPLQTGNQFNSFFVRGDIANGDQKINDTDSDLIEKIGKRLIIYPNPTNGILRVEHLFETKELEMKVYTISGQLVHSGTLLENKNRVDLSELTTGVYILQFAGENFTQVERLIIQ